jgi:hypothetical protein
MRRTLERLLTDLCGSENRARFWLIFGDVGLVLAALWCGLWFAPDGRDQSLQLLRRFTATLGATTFGLLAVPCLLGIVLQISIGRHDVCARRAVRSAEQPPTP